MFKFALQEFGHSLSFSPQALAYDWVGRAVYAGGYNRSGLVIARTSPVEELNIVYHGSTTISLSTSRSAYQVHSMSIDPYKGYALVYCTYKIDLVIFSLFQCLVFGLVMWCIKMSVPAQSKWDWSTESCCLWCYSRFGCECPYRLSLHYWPTQWNSDAATIPLLWLWSSELQQSFLRQKQWGTHYCSYTHNKFMLLSVTSPCYDNSIVDQSIQTHFCIVTNCPK